MQRTRRDLLWLSLVYHLAKTQSSTTQDRLKYGQLKWNLVLTESVINEIFYASLTRLGTSSRDHRKGRSVFHCDDASGADHGIVYTAQANQLREKPITH